MTQKLVAGLALSLMTSSTPMAALAEPPPLWAPEEDVTSQQFELYADAPVYSELVSQSTSLRVDVIRASTEKAQGLHLWPDNESKAQEFQLLDRGDGYFTLKRTRLQLWDCVSAESHSTSANQNWMFVPSSNGS